MCPALLRRAAAARLDACALAGILQGNISSWSDPALVALNEEARQGAEGVLAGKQLHS